jgi:hypothetical protein
MRNSFHAGEAVRSWRTVLLEHLAKVLATGQDSGFAYAVPDDQGFVDAVSVVEYADEIPETAVPIRLFSGPIASRLEALAWTGVDENTGEVTGSPYLVHPAEIKAIQRYADTLRRAWAKQRTQREDW